MDWQIHRRCTSQTGPFRRLVSGVGAVVAILFLNAGASLWSQEGTNVQGTMTAGDPPFAVLNTSLEQTADSVLASARTADAAANKEPYAGATDPKSQFRGGLGSPAAYRESAASRLARLRPVIDPILRQAGVPSDLAAVVLVESGGDPMALSPRGARGLWQLMPQTARRYGLIVDDTKDDRLNIGESTRAAARYLSDLYSEFRSWPLALAAYNTGEQNLEYAIERSRSTDFGVLSSLGFLPAETRNYVPAVLSAMVRLSALPTGALVPVRRTPSAQIIFAAAERSN